MIMVLLMTYNRYFCITTPKIYHSLINLQSLVTVVILCVFSLFIHLFYIQKKKGPGVA
jgi:hypothetical protein